MLTEVAPTKFMVKVNGQVIQADIPSRQLAESVVFQLPADQRHVAEIIAVTSDGKTALFG